MQPFIDSTLAEAKAHGCDTVQIKYDGMPAQFVVGGGTLEVKNFTGYALEETRTGMDPTVACTLIGTYTPHNKSLHIFDCWVGDHNGTIVDLRHEPYRTRYVAAKVYVNLLGIADRLVNCFPISYAPSLWTHIAKTPDAKGLVFRDSHADARGTVRLARWYAERPTELV